MARRSAALVALAVAVLAAAPAIARDTNASPTPAAAPATSTSDPGSAAADPSAPPAGPPTPAAPTGGGAGGGIVDGSRSGGDPLAANGLGGALCRSDRLAGGLSSTAADNCRTAGVSAAPAPVTHYGFDIHIDTGAVGVSGRTFAAAVQTLILTPLWTLLLWVVQAVFALLEWSYAIDLLDAATVGKIADALSSARELFTQPWLALALAIAAVALVYHGLVRRALADSAGQAAAIVTMIVLGLAVIINPAGTVGEANGLVQAASLGTVAAVSANDPTRAQASFADALGGVFATVVEGPWCYMEFGDVEWCREPARLDQRLARAARRLAGPDRPGLRCGPPRCPDGDGHDEEAALLARARTNGDLFLVFAANGDKRNSINDEDSLLRVLCGADSDDDCAGPTAEQARWRTESGTWPRAGGLGLIAVGVAGMVALLGFLALRLLGAAIIAVLCLLLAPVAVLAPALGEGGRAAFRAWGLRLLGALVSKLLYSALLGVVLLMLQVLQGMGALGWWTQWLLIAAFWWTVFAHRHRVLEYATLTRAGTGARSMSTTARVITGHRLAAIAADAAGPGRFVARRSARTTYSAAVQTRRHLRARRDDERRARGEERAAGAHRLRRAQSDRVAEQTRRAAAYEQQRAPHTHASLDRLQARRARLAQRIGEARRAGDVRTVARLRDRDRRLAHAVAEHRGAARDAGRWSQAPGPAIGAGSGPQARHAWLDHQATLKRGVPPGPRSDPSAYRDYPRLAALVGMSEQEYRALEPGAQRRVRLEVDRALRDRVDADGTLTNAPYRDPRGSQPRPEAGAPPWRRQPAEEIALPRLSPRQRQFGHRDDDTPPPRPRRTDHIDP